MATEAEDWLAIAANIRTELRNETARRAALTTAGKVPPITYSVDGRNVSYNEWARSMMQAAIDAEQRAVAHDPYEIHEHGC